MFAPLLGVHFRNVKLKPTYCPVELRDAVESVFNELSRHGLVKIDDVLVAVEQDHVGRKYRFEAVAFVDRFGRCHFKAPEKSARNYADVKKCTP